MQSESGYGGVSEIQQLMLVDTSAQSPFSAISSTQNPSAGVQELQHLGTCSSSPFYKLINPFHPPSSPPPPPMQLIPHLQYSAPITQQLFTSPPHHQHGYLQLFHEPEPEPENYSRGSIMPASFLAADDSSGSGIFQDDVEAILSESRFRPWHRQDDRHIKEPFWRRPADHLQDYCINYRNNKLTCKDKEPEEEEEEEPLLQSEVLFFSELEAICSSSRRPPAGGGISSDGYKTSCDNNYQTLTAASGSALTGSAEQPAANLKKSITRRTQKVQNISAFLSGLAKRLMDHQESLHQKFIDEIERRERERSVREDRWREQQLLRARRDAAARANDRALTLAREATILSFIEKITGETLTLPVQYSSSSQLITTTGRWPRPEVEALIRVRSGIEWRFQEPGLKGPLWEEVSATMGVIGYQRSAKRCKEKWENINKYFRKARDSTSTGRKRSRNNSNTCPYFHQLDHLYEYSKSSADQFIRDI